MSDTERVFQQCTENSNGETIAKIKEEYIELIVLKEGITKGRKVYRRLCKEKPISMSFYQKCIAAEKSQVIPSLKHLRQLYETAVGEFGDKIPGLWLDYISMELKDGNPEVVGQLHWRAMKSLSGEKVEEFVTQYTLLKNSIES